MSESVAKLLSIILGWISPNFRSWMETRQPFVWLLAPAVGFCVALGAIAFREGIDFVQWIWLGDGSQRAASIIAQAPWQLILLGPAAGGLLVGLGLRYLLPTRKTSGTDGVIEACASSGNTLTLRDGISSAGLTALSLGAGASAGREGPIVHLGGCIAASIARKFRLPNWAIKTLIGCGVAAAISASFNAPFAGVIFAHELILAHYAMRAFVPIVISSVTGAVVSRYWFGDVAAFIVPDYQIASYWEFPAFAILGVICGLISVIFQASLMGTDYVARIIPIPLVLRPAIGGLILGVMALAFPQILGVGYETTDQALKGQLPLLLMLSLLLAKTIATAITLASRFGGGVFSPSLYIGAMTGGAFGLLIAQFFPDAASSGGLYAILGMGAIAAAVLGAPISTTLIVFELTGGYALSIALLLCVSIANGINHAVHGHSYFQWQLRMRGLFFADGPSKRFLLSKKVSDFVSPPEEEDQPHDPHSHGPSLRPGDTLEHALRTFDQSGLERLAVVDPLRPGVICGWAHQLHALRFFNESLVEASEEAHHH